MCHSKNKPPALQVEGISSDKSNSCAKIDAGQILGTLCRRKGIEIMEAQYMPDHIHMLVSIPPKYAVSEVVGYLKGKSPLRYKTHFLLRQSGSLLL